MILTLLILDYVWLGYITKDFIIREFGNLVTVEDSGSIKVKDNSIVDVFWGTGFIVISIFLFFTNSSL